MPTTKQPSEAAMEAAREVAQEVIGEFTFVAHDPQYVEQAKVATRIMAFVVCEKLAAIIDRHLEQERAEVREVLPIIIEIATRVTGPNDHRIERAEFLLAKLGGR